MAATRLSSSLRPLARTAPAASVLARRSFSVSASRNIKYGFIGLGRMGYPMAVNLRSKIGNQDTLFVYDVNKETTDAFIEEVGWKTKVAKDVQTVARESDTIITALPEPEHVRKVFESILSDEIPPPPNKAPRLYIDCSTIDPITSRKIAEDVSRTRTEDAFVDAPMSGGVVGSKAGTLTFMLGAPAELVERATETLMFMGKSVVHLGDQGAGLCGKLANNYLLAITNIATAEAFSMGQKWGLDAKTLAGMINTSTGRCWPSEINNPVPGVVEGAPAGRGYEGGFGISLMKKDLRLAIESAKEFNLTIGLGEHAADLYAKAEKDERCKGKDFSSIYRWFRDE